tara:strand:+ start:1883 stop:2425 length:543 start_codon:yes stop_codon:yes gene_type:complete
MNYENINNPLMQFSFEKKYFYSIFGLYLFSLGSLVLGYSVYLLLESTGVVEKNVITWNAQGLFWFLILFCVAIFILFIPVEFLNTLRIYNVSFKDLLTNVILVIFTSLSFLVFFQFFLSPSNQIISDIIDLGKAISFSGFITVPLILFVVHNLARTIGLPEKFSYSFTLFVWVLSSQLFL